MALSRAGWANEMDGFGAINELQLGERHDAVLVERGLEREIEAGEVLIAESRAIVRAILTRRFSRAAISSLSKRSMASSAVVSPRSMPRSVRSKISSTRGIFRLTRLRLTRSITAGAAKAGWALSGGA